jgi:hypothetical protein
VITVASQLAWRICLCNFWGRGPDFGDDRCLVINFVVLMWLCDGRSCHRGRDCCYSTQGGGASAIMGARLGGRFRFARVVSDTHGAMLSG